MIVVENDPLVGTTDVIGEPAKEIVTRALPHPDPFTVMFHVAGAAPAVS